MKSECIFIKFNNHPVACLAIKKMDGDTFKFALSKCHKNDTFLKRIGRNKAMGRLESNNQCATVLNSNPEYVINYLASVELPIIDSERERILHFINSYLSTNQ